MSHIFWISSYPKSGNTLLRAIISSLFFSNDGNFDFKMLNHTTQFEIRKRLNIIKKIDNSDFLKIEDLKVLSKYWLILQSKENMGIKDRFGFVKSHSCLVSMSNNWFTNEKFTTGYLYVVRDPRDIAISWSKHSGLNIDDSIEFMSNNQSCIGWSETKSELPNKIIPKTYLGTWDGHVKSWSENNLDVPKLILRYEDLVYEKKNNINKIVSFFKDSYNINFENLDLKINNIIKSTDFNNLKNLEAKYGFKEANLGSFFRKGEKNQWQSILNNSQIKKIEYNFRDFMNKFSYE